MIEVTSLTKKFNKKGASALDSISFNVEKGETIAIIGENGAGKTTLMRIITSILKPTSGKAMVCGFNTETESIMTRMKIGTLFSGDGIYDRLTARENIFYFARLRGIDMTLAGKHLKKISELLDMDSYLDKKALTFSRGMKQKTSIARAIIHNPEIILLDEPSTGLDITSAEMIRELIVTIWKKEKTILLSSHNASEIEQCAERIIVLHKGRIAEDSPIDEFKKNGETIEDAYFRITGVV